MSVVALLKPTVITDVPENHFAVIHPLDDVPEEKVDTSALGPMPMTASVKYSLLALRGYLVVMILLVFYHALDLAGVVRHGH